MFEGGDRCFSDQGQLLLNITSTEPRVKIRTARYRHLEKIRLRIETVDKTGRRVWNAQEKVVVLNPRSAPLASSFALGT